MTHRNHIWVVGGCFATRKIGLVMKGSIIDGYCLFILVNPFVMDIVIKHSICIYEELIQVYLLII